jgi:hypothetical protein
MTRKILLAACIAPLVVAMPSRARANVPTLINDQGQLFDSTGNPATGTHNLTFTVYDSAGNALWQQIVTNVAFTGTNGYFSVNLDQSTGYMNAATYTSTWLQASGASLGIAVDADPEMSPRQSIAAVPYALSSATAWSVGTNLRTIISGAGDLTINTANGLYAGTTKVIDDTGSWVGPPLPGSIRTIGYADMGTTATAISGVAVKAAPTTGHLISPTLTNVYAYVTVRGECFAPAGDGFNVNVGYTDNGGALQTAGNFTAIVSNQGGAAAALEGSDDAVVGPLNAGDTYSFAAVFQGLSGGTPYTANCLAETTVMYYEQ